MILLTTNEAHYLKYDNHYYDPAAYTVGFFFEDMLAVYERVIFVARCKEVKYRPAGARVDNERVTFYPVKDFSGYTGFLSQWIAFWQCRKVVGLADRYLLQGPGFIASMIAYWLKKSGILYNVHIVGDPEDVARAKTFYWPSWLSAWISSHYKKKFAEFVRSSCGALSVTENYLRQKYPSGIPAKDMGVSDARLPEELFNNPKRNFEHKTLELIIVGILLKYKGHQVLFEAMAKIKDQRDWRLNIVGDGKQKDALLSLAKARGIFDKIVFHGRLKWGEELFQILEKADVFILSSLTEGMPRVLLEAMAKGLPAVATNVGGINEILTHDVLAEPGNAEDLAEKISSVWNNPQRLRELSRINYQRIQDFRLPRLSRLRREWLQQMRSDNTNHSGCK